MSKLSNDITHNFNCFADWCKNKDSLPKEAKHTVEVLLNYAKTDDCDLNGLQNFSRDLTKLDLGYNQIRDLSPLQSLTNLTELYLWRNEIIDISPLQTLTNLTKLGLSSNQISDLSPLQTLTNLTELYLWANEIIDIDPLQTLTNLTELDLSSNEIIDISALENLTNLTKLNLRDNQIRDISTLKNLTNLTEPYISGNRIHAEGEPALELPNGYKVYAYNGVILPEKYGAVHPRKWQPQWILEETNTELRRVLIQGIGYARICQELAATELDNWREYILLSIEADLDFLEPVHLLKMNCPSTGYIHVLRVPSDIFSAREAISWVNWDIDPEEFSIET